MASCHKYPEDPFISFRRPNKRIEGTWNITKYQVWGVDRSHDFDSLLKPNTLTDCFIHFHPFNYITHTGGTFSFIDKNGNPIFSRTGFGELEFGLDPDPSTSQHATLIGFGKDPDPIDSVFFNLFFYKSVRYPFKFIPPFNISDFTIVELYDKHFHISHDGVDMYFIKKQ